jgi:hypothetical protein
MRISPLALTIILALLAGAAAIVVWALLAGHFNPLGTPICSDNSPATIEFANNIAAILLKECRL